MATQSLTSGSDDNEAGTFPLSSARLGQPLGNQELDQQKASFTVPSARVMAPGIGAMHVILRVTDHGAPRLHPLPKSHHRCRAVTSGSLKLRQANLPFA